MKFVIHLHTTETDHYDFMLDNGESLDTWRISPPDMVSFINGKILAIEK